MKFNSETIISTKIVKDIRTTNNFKRKFKIFFL